MDRSKSLSSISREYCRVVITLCLLIFQNNTGELIKDGAGFLLAFLALFFIPATVGIMDYPELLSWAGLGMVLAIVISTDNYYYYNREVLSVP